MLSTFSDAEDIAVNERKPCLHRAHILVEGKRLDKYTFQNVLCFQFSLLPLQVGLFPYDYFPSFCPNIHLHNGKTVASLFLLKHSPRRKNIAGWLIFDQVRPLSIQNKMPKNTVSTCSCLNLFKFSFFEREISM